LEIIWNQRSFLLYQFALTHGIARNQAFKNLNRNKDRKLTADEFSTTTESYVMIEVIEGNLALPSHANALVQLLDEYASDSMGGGEGLTAFAKDNLATELKKHTNAYLVFAFDGAIPAGLVTCFEAFSTFACRPLLNIHDVIVLPKYRGIGLSKRMLMKVEDHAIKVGCCKLTLEVLEGNEIAQKAYRSLGFANYELDPANGRAMFWQKKLPR